MKQCTFSVLKKKAFGVRGGGGGGGGGRRGGRGNLYPSRVQNLHYLTVFHDLILVFLFYILSIFIDTHFSSFQQPSSIT